MTRTYIHPTIFRAQVLNDVDLKKLDNGELTVQRFSYPPKEYARRNRCNKEGYPVFYGCTDVLSCLLESLKTSTGNGEYPKVIIVGEWFLPMPVHANHFDTGARIPSQLFEGFKPVELSNRYAELLEKCFCSDKGYPFSSEFANMIFFGQDGDGNTSWKYPIIMYPSVLRGLEKIDELRAIGELPFNYAFEPKAFDDCFTFRRLWHIDLPSDKTILDEALITENFNFEVQLIGFKNDADDFIKLHPRTEDNFPMYWPYNQLP